MEKLGYLLITGFFVLVTYLTLDQLYGLSLVNEFYPDGLIIVSGITHSTSCVQVSAGCN